MTTIVEFLGNNHRECDDLFAAAETAAAQGNLSASKSDFQKFQTAMEQHFAMEEEVLFPSFEQVTGHAMGPTRVMRLEHQQMREVFDAMRSALENSDLDDYMGEAEALLVLMQQHNMKEERMLYPMCDQALESHRASVIEAMRELPEPAE